MGWAMGLCRVGPCFLQFYGRAEGGGEEEEEEEEGVDVC